MENSFLSQISRDITTISTIVGLVIIAIRAGQWKGEHQTRIEALEKIAESSVENDKAVDKRMDRLDRELAQTLTSIHKDIEYIKKTIEKNGK